MPVQDQITIATYFAQKSEVVPHKYGADFGCHLEQAVEGLCVHDSCLSATLSDLDLLQDCMQVPATEAFPANAHELPDLALSQALRPAAQPLLRLIHLVLTETSFFAYCEILSSSMWTTFQIQHLSGMDAASGMVTRPCRQRSKARP